MSEIDIHSRVATQAFFLELEKIAAAFGPEEVVSAFKHNRALREAAKPDLIQKLKPGTGSLTKAVKDRAMLALGGWKARRAATQHLEGSASYTARNNVLDDNEALENAGRARAAEKELYGKKEQSASPGFFSRSATAPARRSRLRDLAFGVGAGGAGVVGAQMYLNNDQQADPGYQ